MIKRKIICNYNPLDSFRMSKMLAIYTNESFIHSNDKFGSFSIAFNSF